MKSVGTYEAKTHLPRLLSQVEKGESITITKRGKPIAKLVPADAAEQKDVKQVIEEMLNYQQFPTRDFRPENMLVLISHFANSLRIMPSRIPYLTAWANGVARNGYCSG